MVEWGGGAVRRSLRINKELSQFLKQEPDIFVFGEAGPPTKRGLFLPGYHILIHCAKTKESRLFRRGLVIFYREKHTQIISRGYVSKKFDIFWIRLYKTGLKLFFCFFYAPGSHHPSSVHTDFFAELQIGFEKYRGLGDIFMLGDCNVRLGPFLNDRNIHDKLFSSKNKPQFMGFLDYTGMHLLNKIYAFGEPTYEIKGRKKSIIDFAMAFSLNLVSDFKVLPYTMGASVQTCHKIIQLTLKISIEDLVIERFDTNPPYERKMFKYCTYENLLKVRQRVYSKLRDIENIRSLIGKQMHPSYSALLKLYFSAKVKHIGYTKKKADKIHYV